MREPAKELPEPTLSLDPGFIEDVDKRMADEGTDDVNTLINSLQERYQKLRALENSVLQQRQRHQQKEKFNQQTLDVVDTLLAHKEEDKEAVLDYPLAANMFAKAKIPPADTVNLWLGADVMMEYPIKEAQQVLQDNLARCREILKSNKEEWGKIKDCKTTVEVNIARCHNHDVERRRKAREASAS